MIGNKVAGSYVTDRQWKGDVSKVILGTPPSNEHPEPTPLKLNQFLLRSRKGPIVCLVKKARPPATEGRARCFPSSNLSDYQPACPLVSWRLREQGQLLVSRTRGRP